MGRERSLIYGSSYSSCLDSPHKLCSSQGILEWDALATSISTTWELVRYADSAGFHPTPTESETLGWSPMTCVSTSTLGNSEAGSSLRTSAVIQTLGIWKHDFSFSFPELIICLLTPKLSSQHSTHIFIRLAPICPSVQDKTSTDCSVYSHTRSHTLLCVPVQILC